jgi:hypothetical protein
MKVVAKNMLVPGYVENWIVVIDQNEAGLFETSLSVIPVYYLDTL